MDGAVVVGECFAVFGDGGEVLAERELLEGLYGVVVVGAIAGESAGRGGGR